ncbi:ABC transporter permease [Paenibacillus tyrfis]|uniref:ABC transporter permease n=1 Tax=Paenibacillus tyrfis TaxID=1501230 RepID=UPI0015C5EBC7|nr:ABC transporter permease [Paenibacillus tyrfis]
MLTQTVTELMKFKRSKMGWIVAFLVMADCFSCFLQLGAKDLTWDMFLNERYMNLWIRPALFTFITGYLFTRDIGLQSAGMLFTYPFRRSQWYFSKLATAAAIIAMLLALSFAMRVLIGLPLLSEPAGFAILSRQFMQLVLTWLIYIGLVPLSACIALWVRSTVLLAMASLGILIPGFMLAVMSSEYMNLNPWLLPYLYSHYPSNLPDMPLWDTGLFVTGTVVVLSMLVGLYVYTKKNVNYEERA